MNNLFKIKDSIPKTIVTDKGTQIMEGLLLSQYADCPNFNTYLKAFTTEIDFLFTNIEAVYLGRFIEFAVGAQLDVIGEILQQSRAVELPNLWFGFSGAPLVDQMADSAEPADGGLFLDGNLVSGEATPLDDATYKRVLFAKALVLNQDSANIDLAYYFIATIVGRIPKTFIIEEIAHRQVQLALDRDTVTVKDVTLIYYMAKYFVPTGITFTILRI